MSNIFFTADTHYNHANIASKNTSKWGAGYRHYDSIQKMNEDLIANINKHVKQEDTLYHLGDWSFGGYDSIWEFRSRIICENIHLILGNHDDHIRNNKILQIPESDQEAYSTRFRGVLENGSRDEKGTTTARGLFSSVGEAKEISINGKKFTLSHYAHRIWHGSHKGWYHLYGHSHDSLDKDRRTGKLIEYGKSMDVGIDAALRILGEARPFYLQEITKILDKRQIHFPDHHDSKTNT